MTEATLADRYRAYIACLNNRELSRLGDFVADGVATTASISDSRATGR